LAGTRDPSSFSSERACGDLAGCTTAVPWELIVAGGMGATSDKIPPRRTGTVTATRPSAATCLAFQPPGATATTSRWSAALYSTPLDRGSPAGVTWLSTANEALATARHTCSLVSRGCGCLSCSWIVLVAMTASQCLHYLACHDRRCYRTAIGRRGHRARAGGTSAPERPAAVAPMLGR
jgi:hypothetical protein